MFKYRRSKRKGSANGKAGCVQHGSYFVAQLMYFLITRRHSYFLERAP